MKGLKHRFPLLYYFSLFLLILLLTSAFQFIVTSGSSMEPTYYTGDLLLKVFPYREPQVGDIVVIRHQGKLMVKRVAAVAGQEAIAPEIHTITPEQAGYSGTIPFDGLTSDSQEQAEGLWGSTFSFHTYSYWNDEGVSTVPEGCIFVVGDNLEASIDSRDPEFGLISLDQVEGYILFTVRQADREAATDPADNTIN